ncbi:Lrp/AsnC ligand binding domain-containing protein [Actinocorallia libanotica]|uniref:Lrp/AsnC ligand binding domain-containing protein n=1 Tax=Actinocorallia libanotica TaxID=46162 RepID=A0ABN1RA71_9ACTN
MITAIVLIQTEVDQVNEVAEQVVKLEGISEVYSITGDHDLLAMVRVRHHEELAEVIPGRISKVPGVVHTDTHIAFRTYSRHDLDAMFSLGLPEA